MDKKASPGEMGPPGELDWSTQIEWWLKDEDVDRATWESLKIEHRRAILRALDIQHAVRMAQQAVAHDDRTHGKDRAAAFIKALGKILDSNRAMKTGFLRDIRREEGIRFAVWLSDRLELYLRHVKGMAKRHELRGGDTWSERWCRDQLPFAREAFDQVGLGEESQDPIRAERGQIDIEFAQVIGLFPSKLLPAYADRIVAGDIKRLKGTSARVVAAEIAGRIFNVSAQDVLKRAPRVRA